MLRVDFSGIHMAGTAEQIAHDMVNLLKFIRDKSEEIGEDEAAIITLAVRDFAEMSLQSFPYYLRHRKEIRLANTKESLDLVAELMEWTK